MCDNSSSIYRVIHFLLVIIFVSLLSLVSSIVHSSMPVTTRSQTRRGLQQNISSVTPYLLSSTCFNAITSSLEPTTTCNNSETVHNLPELIHQSVLSSSTSEADHLSTSSLENEFENLKFRNSTIALGMVDTNNSLFKLSQFSRMESDYQESKVQVDQVPSLSSNDKILKMLTAISSQMVVGQQDLQNQLIRNDLKLQNELQRVMEENEKFKHEIRAELQGTSFQAAVVDPTSNHFSATSSSSLPPVVSSAPFSGGSSSSSVPTDFQTQMLAVLNNTFSQLSTVISDTSSILLDAKSAMTESKSSKIKSDWIKFSGDSKKFRSWYLAVMA